MSGMVDLERKVSVGAQETRSASLKHGTNLRLNRALTPVPHTEPSWCVPEPRRENELSLTTAVHILPSPTHSDHILRPYGQP